jgi:hypothetical protein
MTFKQIVHGLQQPGFCATPRKGYVETILDCPGAPACPSCIFDNNGTCSISNDHDDAITPRQLVRLRRYYPEFFI